MRDQNEKSDTTAPPRGMLVSGEGLIPSPLTHTTTPPLFYCGLQREEGRVRGSGDQNEKSDTTAPPQGMLVSGEGLIPSPPHHTTTPPLFLTVAGRERMGGEGVRGSK
jgi:hypothetical protein